MTKAQFKAMLVSEHEIEIHDGFGVTHIIHLYRTPDKREWYQALDERGEYRKANEEYLYDYGEWQKVD